MISWLEGKLLSVKAPIIVLNVSGVGYELEVPLPMLYELPPEKGDVALFVHMVVREDAQLLYGFSDVQSRDVFRELLKISGVGPKVALAILSTFSMNDFFQCIANQELAALTAVPGIGKKTAERLMVEMKGRFADQVAGIDEQSNQSINHQKQDAIDALQALGYKHKDVFKAVSSIEQPEMSAEAMIRRALQVLSGRVL